MKALLLPWEDPVEYDGSFFSDVLLGDYPLKVTQHSAKEAKYAIRVGCKILLEGKASTLEAAQLGAEDALKRYLDREGDDIYLAKCNKMLDERLREKRFVRGEIIE